MDTHFVTVGAVGIVASLAMLYYTTGVLLHFVTFDARIISRYMDKLRLENSFEVLIGTVLVYALCMMSAGSLHLVRPAYAPYATLLGFTVLLLGLLYMLWRMDRITAIT